MTPINFLKWSTFFTSKLQSWKFQHFFIFLRQILESKQNYKIRAAGVIELVDVKPRFAIFNIIITWSIKFTHLFPSVCLSHYNNVAEIISFLNTLVLNRSFSSCNVFSKMELNCFKMAPIWSLPSELELFADWFVATVCTGIESYILYCIAPPWGLFRHSWMIQKGHDSFLNML